MILLVGTFPPPVHGMALVNTAVANQLTSIGFDTRILNTSPRKCNRYLNARLLRWIPVSNAWFKLICADKGIVYLALSGGWGQIYDLITVVFARIKKFPIIFHHHSTAYLVSRRRVSALVFFMAGQQATHIVLCEKMRAQLQRLYGCQNVMVLSNLKFFPSSPIRRSRQELGTIGFLSNITPEKGGETMIELAARIKEKGYPIKVVIAGPCQDERLRQKLEQAVSDGILEWQGAVYDDDKAKFWHDIDAFVFPTYYRNEAEPLVAWEALAAGVPVIAYGRGCIPNQIGDAGKIISIEDDFVERSLPILEDWLENKERYREVVEMGQRRYRLAHEQAEKQWDDLINALDVLT